MNKLQGNKSKGLVIAILISVFLLVSIGFAGGINGMQFSSKSISTTIGPWQYTSSMPFSKIAFSVIYKNGYVYTFGGMTVDGNCFSEIDRAAVHSDGSLGPWEKIGDLDIPLGRNGAVLVGDYVYIVAGAQGYYSPELSQVRKIKINPDGSLGALTIESTQLNQSRVDHSVIYSNGYIYAIGGGASGGRLSSVECAPIHPNGSVGVWQYTSSLNYQRWLNVSVTVNGYIYCLGGTVSNLKAEYAKVSTNGQLSAWQLTGDDMPTCWDQPGLATIGNTIFAYGGWDAIDHEGTDLIKVDTNGDGTLGTWINTSTNLNQRRSAEGSVAINGVLYAIGGHSQVGTYTQFSSVEYLNLNSILTTNENGKALQFDGINDVVTISSSSSLTIASTITVEAWIKPNVTNNYGHVIDKSDELTNTGREWGFALDDFGGMDFGIWYPNSANLDAAISHIAISTSQWTHVAGVYDGSSIFVYQNGQLVATAAHSTEIPNTGIAVTIGNSASGNRPFNGLIDEVRVWNFARSQSEIQSSMNCPLDGNENGLVGYWRLDEGSGQVVNDASGNENTGQLGTTPDIDDNDPVWVETDLLLNCSAPTGDDWPMYNHDLGHNALSPDKILNPPFVQKWKFSSGLADGYPAAHGPIIVGNKVFINFGNRMYALNADDGSAIWHYDSDSYFDNCPAYRDGVIYGGAHNGKLYAINANEGTLLSTYPTGGWVRGGAAVSNGIVYFTSFDGSIYAAQTTTLAPVWSKSIGEGNGIESAPAVENGIVYVGGGANVWALDALSGSTIWKQPVDSVSHCSPAITGDMILTGTFGSIYALSKSSGNILWSRTMNVVHNTPVISGDTAFVMESGTGNVYALTLNSGSTIWKTTLPTGYGAYIIGANGYLYIYTGTGRGFATVRMSDGYYLGETIGPDSLPAIANGVYYQGSVNGDLYAFVSQSTTTTSNQMPYIDFLVASDTGRFVYQIPPNLAGAGKPDIHWLPSINGDSGILEIAFTGPNQGVNMTLEIPEWFSADSGQWYILKANASSNVHTSNTLSVGGVLYNGVPPGESALNVDLLVSVKDNWSLLRSYRESTKDQSMYPQLMIRNNNVFPASIYIDYIQVKKVLPPSD